MKKLLLPLLAILLFTSCQKEILKDKATEEISGAAAKIPDTDKTPFVTICKQKWMPKNLDVDHYRNGDVIPQVTDPAAWAGLTTGAWCYYNNSSGNGTVYGKLYNWYAVNDPRGLAPTGWHIPTDAEWTSILNCLGGYEAAGGAMKETGTIHWASPNTGATNSSGFTGLPGGARDEFGLFANIGYEGDFWSSSGFNSTNALFRNLIYFGGNLGRGYTLKGIGLSVRCISD